MVAQDAQCRAEIEAGIALADSEEAPVTKTPLGAANLTPTAPKGEESWYTLFVANDRNVEDVKIYRNDRSEGQHSGQRIQMRLRLQEKRTEATTPGAVLTQGENTATQLDLSNPVIVAALASIKAETEKAKALPAEADPTVAAAAAALEV